MSFYRNDYLSFSNENEKSETKEYISRAKKYVSDGNVIYKNAYEKATECVNATDEKLKTYMQYKQHIADEINCVIRVALDEFKKINIDHKINIVPKLDKLNTVAAPKSTSISNIPASLNNIFPSLSSFGSTIIEDPLSMLDSIITTYNHYKAKRQLDEAEKYYNKMVAEKDKLYKYMNQLIEIQTFIDTEKNEIASLMNKLRVMTHQLKSKMGTNSLTNNDIEYLKGICFISEQIISLIKSDFLSDTFTVSERHKNILAEVESINKMIPESPLISDNNVLNFFKQLIETAIIY